MKLLHALRRPRWLVVIGCAAVLAPAAVLVSGVAATDDVVTSQATPLVDRDYIYGQLFDMAYNDVYRVSGADGPPTDPSSPWNEPADGQRLAGVLPALEAAADRQDGR